MLNYDRIKSFAREAGFDLCGITSVRKFSAEQVFFADWLGRGFAGGMEYLARNIEKRFDPAELVPGVRSVIVCGVVYKNDTSLGYGDFCTAPKIASYARSRDYHLSIKEMLGVLAERINEDYGEVSFRKFTDSAPVLEKKLAVEAGLGFIGRNKLLVSPVMGSFMVLGELFVDAETDYYDYPMQVVGCGNCRRCVESCPNGALTESGLDARRCISRLTVEKIAALEQPRVADKVGGLHGWAFGCDLCQSVCPYNVAAPLYLNGRFNPVFDPRSINVEDWAAMTEKEFNLRFAATPLERAGYERIRESALYIKR